MKTGLVMEGGAMRGLFTAGVLDVFMENGITFDGSIGVSAGAAFGCNFKSGQIGRALRYNKRFCRDKRYCSMHSLIKTGDMFGAEFCYKTIPYELDIFDTAAFEANPMEFYVVCTDAETGKPIYKKCDKADSEGMEWIRASASMPLVSRIVEIGSYKLLDGGVADSIPLSYFESIGYTKNVVILTQPKGYVKKKNRLLPVMRLCLKKYRGILKAAAERHSVYNRTTCYVCEREKTGEVLVIRPDAPLPLKRTEHDPEKLQIAYDTGRKAALIRLDEIKKFLSSKKQ